MSVNVCDQICIVTSFVTNYYLFLLYSDTNMAAAKHPCKNHPEKFTARKCFHCKDPICLDCQKTYFHHLFCSVKCIILWKTKDLFSVFKISKEFTWFILIVIFSNIIMYNLIVSRIDDSSEKIITPTDSIVTFPAPAGYVIDSIRYAVKGRFKINVDFTEEMVLTLLHNGKFVESLLPGEKNFSFNDINLSSGKNSFTIWGIDQTGKSTLIDSFSMTYSAPRLDYLMQPVYRTKTSLKSLALTFDGGSSNIGTKEILDILAEKKVYCTIFLTGQFIQNFPDLVEEIITNGHEVGNHSYSHPHFTNLEIDGKNNSRTYVNQNYLQSQLNRTDSLFYNLTKKHMMPFWRAPFGEINREILFWAAELGYRHIGWSYHCDSWDWVEDKNSELYRTAEDIKNHFLQLEQKDGLNGKIILMHLGSERSEDFPYQTLGELIDSLKSKGYTFKKISELLKQQSS